MRRATSGRLAPVKLLKDEKAAKAAVRAQEERAERMRSYHMAPEPASLGSEDIALYLGKRKTRKSTRAKGLADRCFRRGRQRVLALDPHDEWSVHGRRSPEVILGTLTQRYEAWQVLANPRLLKEPRLNAAVVPSRADPESWGRTFEKVVQLALEEGDLVLFLEEFGSWAEYCLKTMNAAALNSRHQGVPMCAVSQRAKRIPLTFRSQATHINSGLQTEPEDLDALADVAGRDFAAAVERLPRGEYCHWRDT
ncbi:MAG TPA: hypothetical protein VF815_28010 [Myxococcaceae bacterium]|jgi:hypothetical protein